MIQAEIQPQDTHSETPPTVSVIIPAYNAAKYIGEALDSVFDQTFSSHEVIVINDGSPDTEDLERELKGYPAGLRCIKQENRGAAAARNVGLRCARGEFVAFLDADDRWLPNFLEAQLELLNSSKADLVYSDTLLFGELPFAGRTFMEMHPSRGPVTPESLLSGNVALVTSTVLVRKGPLFEVGLFDETLKRGHDFDLWLRLAKLGIRFAYQREVLAERRIVESGLSGNTRSKLQRTLDVLNAIKAREILTKSEDAALNLTMKRALGDLALENGKEKLLGKDFAGALQSFKEAKSFRQNWKLLFVCLGLRITPETIWRIYYRRNAALKGG